MIGIDAKIESLQAQFNSKLFTSIVGNTYTAYGRAFLNEREEGTVPEILYDGEVDYKEVLIDTGVDGQSFFVVENDDVAITPFDYETPVSIYFAVNLKILYPAVTERAVEYLHRDVLEILNSSPFDIQKFTKGREAFSDFEVKIGDNMHPFYLCKFSTLVQWNINEC